MITDGTGARTSVSSGHQNNQHEWETHNVNPAQCLAKAVIHCGSWEVVFHLTHSTLPLGQGPYLWITITVWGGLVPLTSVDFLLSWPLPLFILWPKAFVSSLPSVYLWLAYYWEDSELPYQCRTPTVSNWHHHVGPQGLGMLILHQIQ